MATPAEVLNLLGGLAIVGLGAFVLAVAPRRAGNLALAAFAICYGGSVLAITVRPWLLGTPWDGPRAEAVHLLRLAAVPALAALAFPFPRPLARRERHLLLAAGVFVLAAVAAVPLQLAMGLPPPPGAFGMLAFVAFHVPLAMMLGLSLLLALRARGAEDAAVLRQFALPSAAMAIFPAMVTSPASSLAHEVVSDQVMFLGVVLVAGVWLFHATRASPGPGAARATAWAILGFGLLGALVGAPELRGQGVVALMALLAVALLSYAILRHQLLGIEVGVRWTLGKGTVAGVFVGVFFVASEGAQVFFGDAAGSEWLGIAAAGLLVFAMAPLQRAAERLASAAVPLDQGGPHGPATARARHAAIYRDAARYALRDGTMSRAEELHLAELATALRLSPEEAFLLREEAQAQGGAPAAAEGRRPSGRARPAQGRR